MPPANHHHQPKFTLADCERMQRDLREKRATPKQLSERNGVSLTIIYKIRDGKYGVQLKAVQDAEAAAEAQKNRDPSLCPGCNLPTGVPCMVCSSHQTAEQSRPVTA